MYYTGDFDPEGLIIADKLLARYEINIEPLFYTTKDYESAMSDLNVDDRRLKQLDKIKGKRLRSIANAIKFTGKVGYQELLDITEQSIQSSIGVYR